MLRTMIFKSGGYFFTMLMVMCLLSSCGEKDSLLLPPEIEKEEQVEPEPDTDMEQLFAEAPVIVWVEAAANFSRLGTRERMADVFEKIADMGAKGVVIDVKGISGLVSYNSSLASQLKSWNGYTQANNFDYLANAISEARENGLKVFVSMSVFAEGMNYYGARTGKVFTDEAFAAIQSEVMTASGEVKKITDVYTYGLLNPLQPLAQEYELSLIREVISEYDFDGFVLDYCRYYDICADFSDYSLDQFKEWMGLSAISTTDIVQTWTTNASGSVVPGVTGTYYKEWLEFRAKTIYDFVSEARDAVKEINPAMAFCSYAGAWYDSYYYVGVNWASKSYDPAGDGFSWASANYKDTGYAELLDMFMTGNYTATLNGSGWWTIQGQINGAKSILKDANIHYGAIDIGNTSWSSLENMKSAISMIMDQTKGIMLFDLVHIDDAATNQFNMQLYDEIKSVIQD